MSCCRSQCKSSCTLSNGTVVKDKSSWQNSKNPCEEFVCADGDVSTQISLCRPVPCSTEHQVIQPGGCCPTCHKTWADFCVNEDNDEMCEIVCQHGYVRDEIQNCDQCKCARREQKLSSASKPTIELSLISFIHYNFNSVVILLSFATTVCILGVGLCLHRKVYKKVPLMSVA